MASIYDQIKVLEQITDQFNMLYENPAIRLNEDLRSVQALRNSLISPDILALTESTKQLTRSFDTALIQDIAQLHQITAPVREMIDQLDTRTLAEMATLNFDDMKIASSLESLFDAVSRIRIHEDCVEVPSSLITPSVKPDVVFDSPDKEEKTTIISPQDAISVLAILISILLWLLSSIQTSALPEQIQQNHSEEMAAFAEIQQQNNEKIAVLEKDIECLQQQLAVLENIYTAIQKVDSHLSESDSTPAEDDSAPAEADSIPQEIDSPAQDAE